MLDRTLSRLQAILAVEVIPCFVAFGYWLWKVLFVMMLFVECCVSVASHFRPSLFMVLGEFLFIFKKVLHGSCLVKNLTSTRSPLVVRKRVHALLHEMYRRKMENIGKEPKVTFAYSFAKAILL